MGNLATQRSRQTDSVSDSHREQMIKEFAHVVKAMAYRLAYRLPAYMDADDLVSVGIIGLFAGLGAHYAVWDLFVGLDASFCVL